MSLNLHEMTLTAALKSLQDNKITGKDVTPFLLAFFNEHTDGVSLQANIDLVVNNARLAGDIAMAMPTARTGATMGSSS
jgi:pseudouridine-5'-phosphate glycosidase